MRLADLLDQLQGRIAGFGPLFARYLVDRVPEVFPDKEIDLNAVLSVLVARDLAPQARFVMCSGIVGAFILFGAAPLPMTRKLVEALFRLLSMPDAAELHRNLAAVWIPNVVGVKGKMPRLAPADVLPAALRAASIAALQGLRDSTTDPLLEWVRS